MTRDEKENRIKTHKCKEQKQCKMKDKKDGGGTVQEHNQRPKDDWRSNWEIPPVFAPNGAIPS